MNGIFPSQGAGQSPAADGQLERELAYYRRECNALGARLLRLQTLNSNLCGAPWWIMWVVVVVGFAGLSPTPPAAATPAWIWINLGIGVLGTLATWAWAARAAGRPDSLHARIDDGTGGIRRTLHLLDDLERFERD